MSKYCGPLKPKSQPQIASATLPSITVPCSQRKHAAAFRLGVAHGFNRSKKKPDFILQANKTAYALGFVTGTAFTADWRAYGTNDGAMRVLTARMLRVGKKLAGRELDGRTWDELPK